jgi:hypothetical protein
MTSDRSRHRTIVSMPLLACLMLAGAGPSAHGEPRETMNDRKIVVVVQDDGTIVPHPIFVPEDELEAVQLGYLLAQQISGLEIEGVPERRVRDICSNATVCEEVHIFRKFHNRRYELTISLLTRRGRPTSTATPIPPFYCMVGSDRYWSACRNDVVVRVKNLLQNRRPPANPPPSSSP